MLIVKDLSRYENGLKISDFKALIKPEKPEKIKIKTPNLAPNFHVYGNLRLIESVSKNSDGYDRKFA